MGSRAVLSGQSSGHESAESPFPAAKDSVLGLEDSRDEGIETVILRVCSKPSTPSHVLSNGEGLEVQLDWGLSNGSKSRFIPHPRIWNLGDNWGPEMCSGMCFPIAFLGCQDICSYPRGEFFTSSSPGNSLSTRNRPGGSSHKPGIADGEG